MAVFQVVIQAQAVGSICQTQPVAPITGSKVADSVVVTVVVSYSGRGRKVQGKGLTFN